MTDLRVEAKMVARKRPGNPEIRTASMMNNGII